MEIVIVRTVVRASLKLIQQMAIAEASKYYALTKGTSKMWI